MVSKKTLESRLAILRHIAESEAIQQVKGRIRDGASWVADQEMVPRVIAGSAGILAALLSDTDPRETQREGIDDVSAVSFDADTPIPSIHPSVEGYWDEQGAEGVEMDDGEGLAAVRDLEGQADLQTPPDTQVSEEEAEEHRLPFEGHEEEDWVAESASAPSAASTARKDKPSKDSRAKDKPKKAAKKSPAKTTKSANAARGAEKKAANRRKQKDVAKPAPAEGSEPSSQTAVSPPAKRNPTARQSVMKRPTERGGQKTERPPKMPTKKST